MHCKMTAPPGATAASTPAADRILLDDTGGRARPKIDTHFMTAQAGVDQIVI